MEIYHNHVGEKEIFTPYITRKGIRIYRKNGGMFHFWVKDVANSDNTPKQISMFSDME